MDGRLSTGVGQHLVCSGVFVLRDVVWQAPARRFSFTSKRRWDVSKLAQTGRLTALKRSCACTRWRRLPWLLLRRSANGPQVVFEAAALVRTLWCLGPHLMAYAGVRALLEAHCSAQVSTVYSPAASDLESVPHESGGLEGTTVAACAQPFGSSIWDVCCFVHARHTTDMTQELQQYLPPPGKLRAAPCCPTMHSLSMAHCQIRATYMMVTIGSGAMWVRWCFYAAALRA